MVAIDDPIAFELFKNSIFSIADEMALTICRTTYSGVLRDYMDFSTAFANKDGKLVAQGLTLPAHLGSIPTALDVVVERFGPEMQPEDMYLEKSTCGVRGYYLPSRRRGRARSRIKCI